MVNFVPTKITKLSFIKQEEDGNNFQKTPNWILMRG